MAISFKWTVECDARLKECLEAGMTFLQVRDDINTRFGTGYSRAAIMGRAHRKGFESKRPGIHTTGHKRAPRAKRSIPAGTANIKKIEARLAKKMRPSRAPLQQLKRDERALRCDPVVSRHLDIMQLDETTCRWPSGGWPSGEAITFCGHPRLKGFAYCEPHVELSRPRTALTGMEKSPEGRANMVRAQRPAFLTLSEPMPGEDAAA